MKTALVIVAHPDDEIIWCGGFILDHSRWDWTILSLCRSDDPDRCARFQAVCRALGNRGIISDLDDSPDLLAVDVEKQVSPRVVETVGEGSWDLCITHGSNGEYGHPRHKQVHDAVIRLTRRRRLKCSRLWTFAYDCDAPDGICQPAARANKLIPLSGRTLTHKRRIVQEQYGFPGDSFEVRACISPESFLTIKPTIEEVDHESSGYL